MIFTIGKPHDKHSVALASENWDGATVTLTSTIANPRRIAVTVRDQGGLEVCVPVDGERLAHAVDALFPPSMRGPKHSLTPRHD